MESFQKKVIAEFAELAEIENSRLKSDTRKYQSHSPVFLFVKRFADVFVALLFFFSLGWIFLILWLGVIFTSGRPAIYSQLRYGKNGRVFRFYKLRSMVLNSGAVLDEYLKNDDVARQQWTDFQKIENDPRITKFGNFIRRTSLDEIPQFWNVLIGDMSIVGPRPCMLSQKDLYGEYWDYYCSVRPGITGLWQVSGRNKLSYSKRVSLDVEYVSNLSMKNDFLIFCKTLWVVLTRHGSL